MRGRDRRDRPTWRPRARSCPRRSSRARPGRGGASLARAAAGVPARSRASDPPAAARTCSRPGARSSSGSATTGPSRWSSRTCSGPTPGCSTSSSTLLEWSRNRPIFIVTLARPELDRPAAELGHRHAQLLVAAPRAAVRRTMASCSTAWCPAAARRSRARIPERAEGMPLYAVEMVRMLADRGLLVEDGGAYARRDARASRCPRRCTR